MIRKVLAPAALALVVALVAGTSHAQAAGGTYRIVAGGDQNWTPESGSTDQTAGDKLEASGTMVTTAQRSGSNGTVDYHVAAGPGVVRARMRGSFTVPSNLAYPFNPSLQAVSTTELTISGPDTFYVNTTVNLHVDGIIRAPECGGPASCGGESVFVSIGPFTRTAEFNTIGGTRTNALGLALDPVSDGYRVHGEVTSSTLGILTNTPYPVTIVVNLGGRYGGGTAPTTLGGTFDDTAARYQVSFPTDGPVLNDIPAGYTVSGPSVVDNRWTDPFAAAAPADTTPPVVVGVPDRPSNQFGWYGGPVTIDWQATDDSGVATDPADTVVSADGRDMVVTSPRSCDGSGNCATGSVTLSLDQVAPAVTCPQPEPVFELNTSSYGAIEPTVVEAGSGIVSGSLLLPDVSSLGRKSVTFTLVDRALNSTTTTCYYSIVDRDVEPPVVIVPADMTVDATGPAGAAVTFTATATDNRTLAPVLVCAPASGSVLPVGTTSVACTATDGAGNTATRTFAVRVRGAVEQLGRLGDKTAADLDLPVLRPVLRAEIGLAINALNARRAQVACAALSAYVTTVRLAPPGAFTAAERAELIADANRIRAAAGCG